MIYFPAHLISGPQSRPNGSAPRPAPKPAADVPLPMFHAAQACGAMCLSADGRTAYRRRMGVMEQTFWDEEEGNYSSWWAMPDVEDWPGEAVRME